MPGTRCSVGMCAVRSHEERAFQPGRPVFAQGTIQIQLRLFAIYRPMKEVLNECEALDLQIRSKEIEIAALKAERDRLIEIQKFSKRINRKWAFVVEKIACGTRLEQLCPRGSNWQNLYSAITNGKLFYRIHGIEFGYRSRLERELPKHKFAMIAANLTEIEAKIKNKPRRLVVRRSTPPR